METGTNDHEVETREVIEGFLNTYRQLDAGLTRTYEASANVYALIELLIAKGVIGVEELEERRKIVEKRLEDSYAKAGIGVRIKRTESDKYVLPEGAKIDCENRVHICHAACCRLTYPLSIQDISEGVRWNLGNPFVNARGADGYCVHLLKDGCRCSIYEQRPAVCRSYDCRKDRRIWLDFDRMEINPEALAGANLPAQNGGESAVP